MLNAAERQAKRKGTAYQPQAWAERGRSLKKEMRWSVWKQTLAPGASAGVGDLLKDDERKFMKSKKYLRGFDNDSGMTMLRIGSMNLMLHIIPLWDGIQEPQFFYMDTLSKGYEGAGEYDVILMNPPFKGAVDKGDVHPDLPSDTTKSELLFLHLILRTLDMGGRAAVIVPDGVLPKGGRAAPMWRFAGKSSKRIGWTVWSRHLHLHLRCKCRCKCAFGRFQALRGRQHGCPVLHARRTDEGHLVLRHGARRFFAG